MTVQEFLYVYAFFLVMVFVVVLCTRIWILKPLLYAEKRNALIVSNHHKQSILSEIGIKVNGSELVVHIAPPEYTADEHLLPGFFLDVWTTPNLPGMFLTKKPNMTMLLLMAMKTSFIAVFLLVMPVIFIIKGMCS